MRSSCSDPVDDYLRHLGQIPTPPDLATRIVENIDWKRAAASGPRWQAVLTLAVAAVGLMVVASLTLILPSLGGPSTPSFGGNGSVSQGGSGSLRPTPTATASATGSPLATVSTSPMTVVMIEGEAGSSVSLQVFDASGILSAARSATAPELRSTDEVLASAPIAALNWQSEPTQILVIWAGSSCDATARLSVAPRVERLTLALGPRPGCDLAPNPRGVVLSFRQPVSSRSIALEFAPAVITP